MNLKDTKLNVSELFVSKHGEGHRAGTENIFVRLQDCKAKDANDASGIRCDTEFVSGRTMTLEELNLWMLDNAPLTGDRNERTVSRPQKSRLDFGQPESCRACHRQKFLACQRAPLRAPQRSSVPCLSITADHLCLLAHSDGYSINEEDL
jgi:hypothetical protein